LPVSFISLRFERVDNLGAYRIPPETGILIPSGYDSESWKLACSSSSWDRNNSSMNR
jgi:hypothetical protein